ncbi:MAG: helix-turn-helix domain-containing protein [Alphaproteobacteria bacterium]
MAQPKIVRGLLRGLDVLKALNENNYATVLQLSKTTRLPRATIYRLLDTLIQAGYVVHGGRKDTYRLTIRVRALSDGFNDDAWVTEVASPILAELGRKIVWPTDIATFERDAMVIRETTGPTSPLSINREKAGFRAPVLVTALGRAYLAYCSESEREIALHNIASSDMSDAPLAKKRAVVERILRETRTRGYGWREGGISPKTGSIAVPVIVGSKVIACINIHYILSALSLDEVVKRYLAPMREAAEAIARALVEGHYAVDTADRIASAA